MGEVTVDFIARDPWRMVLVERGPWDNPQSELIRLQDRLYTCIDAAVDGQLAEQFPDSAGADLIIELHGYSLPLEAQEFFSHFSQSVPLLPGFATAVAHSPHVSSLKLAATFA